METRLDFLEEEFIEYKCSRCRKDYTSMRLSLGTRTCPPCSNKNEIAEFDPEGLLIAIDLILDKDTKL